MTIGALLLMKGAEIDCFGQLATEEGPRNGRKHTQKVSSPLTGGSLYWSGPHSILPGGPPQLPSTPGGRPLQIYELYTHRTHLPAPEQRQKTH